MKDPTNKDRARWALAAVKEYARIVGDDIEEEEGLETAISDLLADLRHLCDKRGISFYICDHRGHEHYTEEVVEEN